jgi:uncharacterized protein YbjT (DUF2867 family)
LQKLLNLDSPLFYVKPGNYAINNLIMKTVFITGGSGYIGTRLIKELVTRKFRVIALVRAGSASKIPAGAETIIANPFDSDSFQHHVPRDCIFVQLLGVAHPSPKKAHLFKQIDLNSVVSSAIAASFAGVTHFIYVSVAMEPSSIMRAYQDVRKKGEVYCISSGLNCTFIRPWYVLGPGHRWPVLLLPVYAIARLVPSLKAKTEAFELVTINQMIDTLVKAVESVPRQLNVLEVADIKRS